MRNANTSSVNDAVLRELNNNLHIYSAVYSCDSRAKACLDALSHHYNDTLSAHELVQFKFTTKHILNHAARNAENCPIEFVGKVWAAANYAEALMFAFESPLDAAHIKECLNEVEYNKEVSKK